MSYQIAIDGPSGAGKSTIARKLAENLGFMYIDTGAMYRSVGLYFYENNISFTDLEQINSTLSALDIKLSYVDGEQRIYLNNEDVSDKIRSQEVSELASKVAVIKEVREKLVKKQKEIAKDKDVVMDGRDIARKVLIDANLKIYLDASSYTRALRRQKQLNEKEIYEDLQKIKKEIDERDFRDKNRAQSPLTKTNDSIYIDTSSLSVDEVVEKIKELIKK